MQPFQEALESSLEEPGTGPLVPEPGPLERARRVRLPEGVWQILSNRKAALGVFIIAFLVAVALVGPLIWPGDPMAPDYSVLPMSPPSHAHWFGTDQQGHDIFLQMVDGTRPAVIVGFSIAILATLLGLIGMVGGYMGGWVDEILNTIINIFLVIPAFPLMIVIAGWVHVKNDLPAIVIISLTSWPWGARVLRSQTMSLRQRDFIQASIVTGQPAWRIILFEILPNMASLVVSGFIGLVVVAIGSAAGLAFLGLGNIQEASWFTILYWAQQASALQQGAWWAFVIPGAAIALFGVACILINYGIDEVSNPRLRVIKSKSITLLPEEAMPASQPAGRGTS